MLDSIRGKRLFLVAATMMGFALAGCTSGGEFKIAYDAPLAAEVTRGWRVADVRVTVPASLTVSEAAEIWPRADIVWREDPPGDRRAQVAAIMKNAVRQGASGLNGSRRVYIDVQVSFFHALTFEAEARVSNAGVHNINYTVQVVDAGTGAVLAGPYLLDSDSPAFSGPEAIAARAAGQTQKGVITAAVRKTIAGWLGIGADPRYSFNRLGG